VLLADGRAKLLDFGLARLMAGASNPWADAGGGTPGYMAPEQWRRGSVDARTDIWAAGLIFFELLTGEHPFPTLSLRELRERITSAEPMPSVRERRPELPVEVERLVATALAKAPAERFADGTELRGRLLALEERLVLRPVRPASLRARVAERRLVTLVSCGLVLAGESEAQRDPEDESELEAAFHQACASIFRQHGGLLTTAVGAEVQACFGYPAMREADSHHAVRAALHLKEALARELASRLSRVPRGLAVKVGVHTGVVTLTDATPELHGVTPAMQGEAPKLASWLASQAPPDAVLLTGRTFSLVRGRFETRPLEPRRFDGLSGPRRIVPHEVLRERVEASRFDRALVAGALTPLVGRERELRQLGTLWSQALAGRGVCVLLRGEAGIGKSRLVQELHDREAGGASTWVRCQCWPQHQGSAFHPLIDWLGRFLGLSPDTSPEQARRRLEEALASLGMLPEHVHPLASFLSLPLREGVPFLLLAPDRQRERERVLQGLGTLLRRLAAQRPLVLLVEDLHWADPSTLQFLDTLVGHVEDARACVLLTARSEFQHAWEGRPGFHELKVERLPPEAAAALVREAAGGRALPEAMVEQLVVRTDGIPFFAEEMTRMVLEREAAPESIPVGLHELLLARLDVLPPREKVLAQQAATLGREFPYTMLRAVSSLDEDALLLALERLERAGLLFRHGAPPCTLYTFKHALLRDAAYQSMPRGTRQRYHAQILQVLEARFPEVQQEQPELLAQHASQAGLAWEAVEHWRRAAEWAGTKSAFSEAIQHFNRALEQLAACRDSRERDQREVALRSELGMALIATRGFAAPEVEETYTRARALCERFGDIPLSVLWGIWVIALVRGDREGTDQLAAHFQRILDTSEDPVARVVVGAALASRAFWRGECRECVRHCLAAKEVLGGSRFAEQDTAIRGGAQGYVSEQWLNVYLYLALGSLVEGDAVEARAAYREALALAEEMDHPYAVATARMFGAALAHEAREAELARDESALSLALSSENGFAFILAIGNCLHGLALARLGEAPRGIAQCREGLALLQALGARVVLPIYSAALAHACLLGGEVEEGLAAARAGLEVSGTNLARHALPELWRLEGELLLARGDAAARASMQRAVESARGFGARLHELRSALSLARLMRREGEGEAARVLLAEVYARFPREAEVGDARAAREFLAEP
jgi:class 3 adenylate cyclase